MPGIPAVSPASARNSGAGLPAKVHNPGGPGMECVSPLTCKDRESLAPLGGMFPARSASCRLLLFWRLCQASLQLLTQRFLSYIGLDRAKLDMFPVRETRCTPLQISRY